jgi:saccharopine dehydrogenase (NAD+, L-lysine-forming)
MTKRIRLGLVKETKTPPDRRIVLTPLQVIEVMNKFSHVEVVVQPSNIRAFKDEEYENQGIKLLEDLSDCDILIGVKEVKLDCLIPQKTYLFFSHTIKKQAHNQKLFRKCMELGITLLDHEILTDERGNRVVAFGRWAGMVGAYNGLIGWGLRNKTYNLKRAVECHDRIEISEELKKVKLENIKVLITGGGRVAHGAMEIFSELKIHQVDPQEFLENSFDEPVVCRLDPWDYVIHKNRQAFDFKEFTKHPEDYESSFLAYTKVTDFLIPCHFWDPKSPVFFTANDMLGPEFKIKMIADVSCDIDGPIPSTLRASTIAEPFYGYNPRTKTEDNPWLPENVSVMAIDNLPGELPRDAAEDFGRMLIDRVFPSLFGDDSEKMIERATLLKNGKLGLHFQYLKDYSEGK